MSRVILLDAGYFMFCAIFSYAKRKDYPPTFTALRMMIGNLKRIGIRPDDLVIIAVDSKKGSWRKDVDPQYKANRKESREKHDIDWKKHFEEFNNLYERLDGGTPFHVINIEKCVSGDTRIDTPNGQKRISTLIEGQEVYSYNIEKKKIEISKVKKLQKTKSFTRYNVFFEDTSLPLKITGEHPVYTKEGWKEVKDLQIGDVIYHRFDSDIAETNDKAFLGYFYGYLEGDGYINYKIRKVFFTSCDKEGIDYLNTKSKRFFNCKVSKTVHEGRKKHHKKVYTLELCLKSNFYSLVDYDEYNNDLEYQKGFVGGFFDAEGTFNKERNIIRIVNTDEKPMLYVFSILEKLGFNPKKYKFISKNKKKKDIYAIDLNGEEKVTKFFQTFKTCIKRKKINTISNGLKIRRIEKVSDRKAYINFNFESVPNNNYFANSLLVHNCEADDIIAFSCRYFKDRECIIISVDADYEQLVAFPNVKLFSPISKRYKNVKNPYAILASKIRKEQADNLITEIHTELDYEKREKIVNLLRLPEEIDKKVEEAIHFLPEKDFDYELIPFNSIKESFKTIYGNEKYIVPENSLSRAEKRKLREEKRLQKLKEKYEKKIKKLEQKNKLF